jgi:hypothetical protein
MRLPLTLLLIAISVHRKHGPEIEIDTTGPKDIPDRVGQRTPESLPPAGAQETAAPQTVLSEPPADFSEPAQEKPCVLLCCPHRRKHIDFLRNIFPSPRPSVNRYSSPFMHFLCFAQVFTLEHSAQAIFLF